MPLIKVKDLEKNSKLGLWKIVESDESLLAQLKLTEKQQNSIQTISGGKHFLHWLGSQAMLRKMLKTDDFVDISLNQYGKPNIRKHKVNVSISHAEDMAAVLISEDAAVGVDMEFVEPRIQRVAHKFMNREELDTLNEKDEIELMYMYWCAKEALYKVYAKEKLGFRENLPIGPINLNGSKKVQTTGKIVTGKFEKEYNIKFERMDDYVLAYVIDN